MNLLENTTLQQLATKRDEFIENPGTDPHYEAICDILCLTGDESDEEIHSKFFDHMMFMFQNSIKGGMVKVYRMVGIVDIDEFVRDVQAQKPLGIFWTHDEVSASTEYSPTYSPGQKDVLLVADAPVSSIDWESSLVANYGHADEQEITVVGPVMNVQIYMDEKLVATVPRGYADSSADHYDL